MYLIKINLLLIALICATRMWVINIGMMIPIFKILQIIFIISFILFIKKIRYQYNDSKILIYFFVTWFLIHSFSIFINLIPGNYFIYDQFLKGIIISVVDTIFFIFFILFLDITSNKFVEKLINFFFIGVIFSSILEIIQTIYQLNTGDHLTTIIWNTLSYNSNYSQPQGLEMNDIWRADGLAGGVNPAGLYISTSILFMIQNFLKNNSFKSFMIFVLLLVGGIITFSRSGFYIPFLLSFFFLFIFNSFKKIQFLLYLILFLFLPLSILIFNYYDFIMIYVTDRTSVDYTRLEIYKNGLEIWFNNPFGVGANVYDFHVKNIFGPNYDENPHNSYLAILIEYGIQGIIFYLYYFYYILRKLYNINTEFSFTFLYTFIGILIGAFFNMTFDLFFFQFWLALFFVYSYKNRDNSDVRFIFN